MILIKSLKQLIACFSLLCITSLSQANSSNDNSLQLPVGGQLAFTGSTALSNLISDLTHTFSEYNPLITVTIADSGGMAGLDALINGSADMVLSSTPIIDQQKKQFEERYGYSPEIVPIAMDALIVYVNNLNPLGRINIKDLDAIFSNTYRCGKTQEVKSWDALEVKGILSQRQIHIYGLTVNTRADSLFRQVALCGGDFRKDFQALPGSAAIEEALISDYAGIGFSNSAIRSPEIHALAIGVSKNTPAIAPNKETIRSKQYPMSRTLSIVINHRPNQPMPPSLKTFLMFVRSTQGKDVIKKAGYVVLEGLDK